MGLLNLCLRIDRDVMDEDFGRMCQGMTVSFFSIEELMTKLYHQVTPANQGTVFGG